MRVDIANALKEKLRNGDAVIGVIGLGYVGLPLLLRYCEAGFKVLGFDVDAEKVALLHKGSSYLAHIRQDRISAARAAGLDATCDFSRASGCDALILCVPTPLDEHRAPDMRFVLNTIDELEPHWRAGQVVSLESTTYPGTTEELVQPRVEKSGLTVGEDVFLVYSPEREDPGNADYDTRTIPKVLGGQTSACLDVGMALYEKAIDKLVPVSSTRTAEMVKLLENIHRAVNIGLVNEMKIVAARMGIDIREVIDAAASKPFGFVPYYPGPGLGGHCIPIDPFYLTWKAREFGVNTRFIELAGEVNNAMPDYVVSRVVDGLNGQRKALNGARILVMGIAYKKNVGDTRESPSARIMELLQRKGATLAYSDPYVPQFPLMRNHQFDLESTRVTNDVLATFDCVLIATDHDAFDYESIQRYASLIVDSRGVYHGAYDNVVKA